MIKIVKVHFGAKGPDCIYYIFGQLVKIKKNDKPQFYVEIFSLILVEILPR
jgi:hypothetical protein